MGTSVSDTPDLQPRVSFLQLAWKHLNFYIENQKHASVFFRQLPVHDVDGQIKHHNYQRWYVVKLYLIFPILSSEQPVTSLASVDVLWIQHQEKLWENMVQKLIL